jgi:hypothetical protein
MEEVQEGRTCLEDRERLRPQQQIRLDSEKKARQELKFIAYALNDLDFVKGAQSIV